MALQLHDYPTDLKAAWRGCKTFAVASQFVFWLKCSILVLKTFWGCQAQATILYNEKMISDNLRAKPTPKTANIKCPVSTMVPNSFGTHLQILALNRNHCQIIISTCRAKAKATALLKQTQIARKDHHALYKGPVFPFCGCLDYPYCDPFGLMDHSLWEANPNRWFWYFMNSNPTQAPRMSTWYSRKKAASDSAGKVSNTEGTYAFAQALVQRFARAKLIRLKHLTRL